MVSAKLLSKDLTKQRTSYKRLDLATINSLSVVECQSLHRNHLVAIAAEYRTTSAWVSNGTALINSAG